MLIVDEKHFNIYNVILFYDVVISLAFSHIV